MEPVAPPMMRKCAGFHMGHAGLPVWIRAHFPFASAWAAGSTMFMAKIWSSVLME